MAELFDIQKTRTAVSSELEGVWMQYTGNSQLKIARQDNEEYQNLFRELAVGKYAVRLQDLQDGQSSPDALKAFEELQDEVRAHTILKDVSGMAHPYQRGEDGSLIEWDYTPEVGMQVLRDPAYHDLKKFVVDNSQQPFRFRENRKPAVERSSVEAAAESVKSIASSSTSTGEKDS